MSQTSRDAKLVEMRFNRQVQERRGLIDLLSAEVEAQRQSYSSRSGSMNTRLSVLVAAASLVSGLQISSPAALLVHPGGVPGGRRCSFGCSRIVASRRRGKRSGRPSERALEYAPGQGGLCVAAPQARCP
jgi:hypothetical protein